MVPGGRVDLPTPAFSGPRSTGELPRHRGSKRFYGRARGVSIKDSDSSTRPPVLIFAERSTETANSSLFHRRVELPHPVFALQDFARFCPVGGSHNAVFLHDINEPGGSAVPDPQTTLQGRSGRAARFADYAHGFLIKRVVHIFGSRLAIRARCVLIPGSFEQPLVVDSFGLRAPVVTHSGDFILGDEWPVHSIQAR